jgi:peptidoglycan hydrolase CwlO-like protein
MSQHLTRRKTPEEAELDQKKAKLASLESELVQRELDLATLQGELRNFEARYLRIVGARYADLDDIEAQIAEAIARRNPADQSAGESARTARAKARETASAVAQPPETTTPESNRRTA